MRGRRLILAVVEGHGEQTAVPALLRRWFRHRHFHNFETRDPAIRAPGAGALTRPHDAEDELGVEYYVEIAAAQRPDGILIVLDADDECLERAKAARPGLGPELRDRARKVAPHIPIEVVVANREYEAWFLAGLAALRRKGKVPPRARLEAPLASVEAIRDCKKRMNGLLGRPYEPSVDQRDLSEALPFTPRMGARSPSYRKLLKALDALTMAARARPPRGSEF